MPQLEGPTTMYRGALGEKGKIKSLKKKVSGLRRGRLVEFACSASAARGFASSDPGRGHGTARQDVLGRRPASRGWREPQLGIQNYVLGGFGRKRKNKIIKKKRKSPREIEQKVQLGCGVIS